MSGDERASILVVEDDDEIRSCLQQVLELEGFHVEAAANGREALDRLATTERPCVILLDLLMPVMNGLEFMEAMGTDDATADIPVVVVSAYADVASRMPAAAWLEKPAELDDILDVVHRFCRRPGGPGQGSDTSVDGRTGSSFSGSKGNSSSKPS